MWPKKLSVLFVIVITLPLASCSLYNKTAYSDDEGRLPSSFFKDLHRDKTSQAWVVSQLGTPESIQQGPEGKQIFNYPLSRTEHKHADLFVVMRIDDQQSQVEYLHIFFDKQLVRKHWRDQYSQAQTTRYFSEKSALISTAGVQAAYTRANSSNPSVEQEMPEQDAAPTSDSESGSSESNGTEPESIESNGTSATPKDQSLMRFFKIWPWSTSTDSNKE